MSAIAALLYLQSCGDKNALTTLNGLTINTYPAAVNDQWVYQVSDSVGNIIDTATFTITAASTFSDSTVYKTRTMVGNTVTDSGTILQIADSITYRPSGTQSLFEYLKLVFPIQINGSWQGYYPGDSLHVIAYDVPLTELGNSYPDAYELSRFYVTPAYAVQATVYLTPNVGIAEETIQINTLSASSKKTLKLISVTL